MHLHAIKAIFLKDVTNLIRNRAVVIGLFAPLIVSLGIFALTTITNNLYQAQVERYKIRILVSNPDTLPVLTMTGLIERDDDAIIQNASDPGQVQRELSKSDSAYSIGLVLPAGLETQLANLQHPSVYLYFNPQLLGNGFQKYVANNVSQYLRNVADQNPPFQLSISVAPVTTDTAESTVSKLASTLDDPQSINGLGQSSVVVFLGIFLALSMTPEIVIEEKERRTMQMLLTSPAGPLDVVIAKSLLGIIYVVLAVLPVTAFTWGVYHNPLLAVGFILLTLIFGVGLGLLVGALFDNNKAAQIWASLVAIMAIGPGVVGLLLDDTAVGAVLRWWPTYPMFSGIRDAAADSMSLGSGLLGMTLSLAYIALAFVGAAFLLRHRITHR